MSVVKEYIDQTRSQEDFLHETRDTLLAMCQRKVGNIPQEIVVEQVIRVTANTDWNVRKACLEEILKRISNAKRDQLVVTRAPTAKNRMGRYVVSAKEVGKRPYVTVLRSANPIIGSCNCPDYLKNSLGVCKHILVALNSYFKAAAQGDRRTSTRGVFSPVLWLHPVREFTGSGDILSQVRFDRKSVQTREATKDIWSLNKLFIPAQEYWVLKDCFIEDQARRLILVKKLLSLVVETGSDRWEPALKAVLNIEERRLSLKEKCIRLSLVDFKKIGLKKKLFDYQMVGVRAVLCAGRFVLADDMGLGKTAQAIATVQTLFKYGNVKRALLVVPASLKMQWYNEWSSFSDLPISQLEGTLSERTRVYQQTTKGILITNYEQLIRDLGAIQDWNPDIVVLDEAQRIKNWQTKTALSVKTLTPEYKLVLTGTPMENRIDELASILDWIDPHALEPKWRLHSWHSITADGTSEVIGVRNLETLRQRMSHCMLRRIRSEVLDQLPKRNDQDIFVKPTEQQMAAHDELSPDILQLVARGKKRPLTHGEFLRLMSLFQLQRIILNALELTMFDSVWPDLCEHKNPTDEYLKLLHAPKLLEFRELIKEVVIQQKRKVIVFSQWTRMLDLARWSVEGILQQHGLQSAYFTGREKQARRARNVVEFHDDPQLCVLFLSDAGGVGLNLQRAANCCINLDLPWNPAVLEQRIGRIYRLGQKQPINVYNLIASYGIEMRMASIVQNKKAYFKGLFDGKSDQIEFSGSTSFMSRIEKLVDLPVISANNSARGDVESEEENSNDEIDSDKLDEVEESLLVSEQKESMLPLYIEMPKLPEASIQKGAADGTTVTIATLAQSMTVSVQADGTVTICAKPEVAGLLADALSLMASMLRR